MKVRVSIEFPEDMGHAYLADAFDRITGAVYVTHATYYDDVLTCVGWIDSSASLEELQEELYDKVMSDSAKVEEIQ